MPRWPNQREKHTYIVPPSGEESVAEETSLPEHGEGPGMVEITDSRDPKHSNDLVAAFMAAMKQMSAENRETTLAAIQEMKKLSPEDQARADSEKQQLMEQTLRRVEAAKVQAAEIAERQAGCAHTMPNGQTNFRGQVLSNGWAHVFCSHCHKEYDFEATDVEANKSGLNVDKWGPNAHAIIRNRVAASKNLNPPPVPRVPAGATIIFG